MCLLSVPVYECVYICVTDSGIQNEADRATQKEAVLVCVFRQAVREILLSREYNTTRRAIRSVLILNQAWINFFLNFAAPSLSVSLLVSVVFIFHNVQHKCTCWD